MSYVKGMGTIADCTVLSGWLTSPECWGHSIPFWQQMKASLAPPPAPTGSVLTTPPASGAEAQQTVDVLLNEQMKAQQAADAAQVQPVSDIYSLFNQATGSAFAGGGPPSLLPSINWTTVALVTGGIVAVLILVMGRR